MTFQEKQLAMLEDLKEERVATLGEPDEGKRHWWIDRLDEKIADLLGAIGDSNE